MSFSLLFILKNETLQLRELGRHGGNLSCHTVQLGSRGIRRSLQQSQTSRVGCFFIDQFLALLLALLRCL
jgi:hypothetical protein